jgi:hypothetical protein
MGVPDISAAHDPGADTPKATRTPRRRGIVLGGALVVFAALVLFANAGFYFVTYTARGEDDSYISYRYAFNLANGDGLVFNPGERPVEGYSNFLYVLIIAAGFLSGFIRHDDVYFWSVGVNLFCGVLTLALLYRHTVRRFGPSAAGLGVVWLAATPQLGIWIWSGFETGLVLLIQLGILHAVYRVVDGEKRSTPLLLGFIALSILARADGFIAPCIVIAYLVLCRERRAAALACAGGGVVAAGYLAWRYTYYGYLLPNTYYAKVAGPLGVRIADAAHVLAAHALPCGLLVPLCLLAVFAVAEGLQFLKSRTVRGAISFEVFFSVAWLAYWFTVSDVYNVRFLLTLFPVGILLFLRAAGDADKLASGRATLQWSCALAFIGYALYVAPFDSEDQSRRPPASDGRIQTGRFLREKFSGKTLAASAAGKIPYFSGLRTYDILGLSDDRIAHEPAKRPEWLGHAKWNNDRMFSEAPDVIATWIGTDLSLPMINVDRAEWRSQGYEIRYLCDFWNGLIRDVSTESDDAIIQRIAGGFGDVLLVRTSVREK